MKRLTLAKKLKRQSIYRFIALSLHCFWCPALWLRFKIQIVSHVWDIRPPHLLECWDIRQ
jgi:hypothetical protein